MKKLVIIQSVLVWGLTLIFISCNQTVKTKEFYNEKIPISDIQRYSLMNGKWKIEKYVFQISLLWTIMLLTNGLVRQYYFQKC